MWGFNVTLSFNICNIMCSRHCIVVRCKLRREKLREMWQCLFVVVETQQREKEKRQCCTLSRFQYIMLTRGILLSRSHSHRHPLPPPSPLLSLFLLLSGPIILHCLLSSSFYRLLRVSVCVCARVCATASAIYLPSMCILCKCVLCIYILDGWFLHFAWWLGYGCECVHVFHCICYESEQPVSAL